MPATSPRKAAYAPAWLGKSPAVPRVGEDVDKERDWGGEGKYPYTGGFNTSEGGGGEGTDCTCIGIHRRYDNIRKN